MQTNEQLLSAIENYLAQTEFPAEPELLYAPIGYSLAGGGKRLRPMLLMLSNGIFTDKIQHALPAAAAVEVFHNFTLLHDDIMDNAAVRRGKPSVYAKWGQNVAILSGDAMLICAYRLLGEVPAQLLPQILSTFNTMALEVCEGQQYDMDFERKPKVSVVEYMHMIELKTSVLLAGATTIGALLGGASEEDCRKLRRFAIELGLAFQLQDDLLDSYGDERLGKAIGGDILEGKQTYLMITAISRADEPTREVLRSTHRSQMPDAEKIATIKAVYDRLDIPRLTEQQISLRFERALGILDTLSVEKSRTERMREYALSLMGRKTDSGNTPHRDIPRKRHYATLRDRNHGPRRVLRSTGRSHTGRGGLGIFRRREAQHALGVGCEFHARRPGEDRRHGTRRRGQGLPHGQHHRLRGRDANRPRGNRPRQGRRH